ncbi:hypothetical protein ES676_08745 [Bizionia saleffrena]|uniref:Uncharacterized protein n=1 Tax=Bizionia saleffrena TaxID=291189 RepID=A0A8H2LCM1_9FLAO|nr:hypothetical protein [Bizionia saleffrena]TYB73821.1 hypothetical protein ES676_08745 [Bizionia saleffrena]
MKANWCFSVLLLVLACIGVFRDDTVIPNQELVLEFNSAHVSANEAEKTIILVKKQLQELGVYAIQVHAESNGKYTITYYSASNVARIKKILGTPSSLSIDIANSNQPNSGIPLEKTSNHYHVDVYEITRNLDSEIDLKGTLVVNEKRDLERFNSPTFSSFLGQEYSNLTSETEAVAYKINTTIVYTLNKGLYTIPEVRAGPSYSRSA